MDRGRSDCHATTGASRFSGGIRSLPRGRTNAYMSDETRGSTSQQQSQTNLTWNWLNQPMFLLNKVGVTEQNNISSSYFCCNLLSPFFFQCASPVLYNRECAAVQHSQYYVKKLEGGGRVGAWAAFISRDGVYRYLLALYISSYDSECGPKSGQVCQQYKYTWWQKQTSPFRQRQKRQLMRTVLKKKKHVPQYPSINDMDLKSSVMKPWDASR